MKYSLSAICLFIISCSSIRNINQSEELVNFAREVFGEDVTLKYNESKTFVVCYVVKKSTPQMPGNHLKFGIIDVAKNKLIYQDAKRDGSVEWVDEFNVQIKAKSEVFSKDDSLNKGMTDYKIDVRNLE
ncbi:hypothetical protein DMA11_01565 [Marinilabiliaceae bacterium JC017]|nr:hypothetical protein DMA11_01565 [Marinilabiliaceae bacterium JC017]